MKTICRIALPAALVMALLTLFSCGEESKMEIDDLFPPVVKWSSVRDGAIDVSTDATFQVRFVEELDPASVDSSALFLRRRSDGFLLPAALSYDESERTVSIVPDSPLERETFHDLVATESLRDKSGNEGREHKIGFDTSRPPTVISVSPADGAIDVSTDTIQAIFSETMDPATLTPSSFGLEDPSGDAVAGSVSYDAANRRATFAPAARLKGETTYRATISAVASDPAGNGLKSPYSWSFETIPGEVFSFEDNRVPPGFTLTGDANWFITNDSAALNTVYSIRSGDIQNSQSTCFQFNYATDKISFYRKISSESGFDYLKFYIDNSQKASYSGAVDWGRVTFTTNIGAHVFKWCYSKDGSVSRGLDAAWVDEIGFE